MGAIDRLAAFVAFCRSSRCRARPTSRRCTTYIHSHWSAAGGVAQPLAVYHFADPTPLVPQFAVCVCTSPICVQQTRPF
ncbi:hypothetical protein OH76DRAFT_832757 [Lentinus brumalis]|uniref:Uncharacterized protein n=1 Tax=Lentinus brumalis TaxID=2498619 RepID=A0A371D237_9APHY|nr:hypothetical protein OH76DRAFT_832757 [Polyporus brumalis]